MIRQLKSDLRSLLRSEVAISSQTQCVEELVLNSLDAKASCIAIRIDFEEGNIQVVDNGKGIEKSQLAQVAERYFTSKCHRLADLDKLTKYGYRGEALASIRDVAAHLVVDSKHVDAAHTYHRTFTQGNPSTVKRSKQRPSTGTTVSVKGLFYNLPVRQKHIVPSVEQGKLVELLETISLVQPNVSMTLRNDQDGNVLLQTHKSSSVLKSFGKLFGSDLMKKMKEIRCKAGRLKINGYIATTSYPHKNLQFVYVNERVVMKTKIHKAINHYLKHSDLIRSRTKAKDSGSRAAGNAQAAEKHGVYIINLTCPHSDYDVTFDPKKTLIEFKNWTEVLGCLEYVVNTFLKMNNFLPEQDTALNVDSNQQIIGGGASEEITKYGQGITTAIIPRARISKTVTNKKKAATPARSEGSSNKVGSVSGGTRGSVKSWTDPEESNSSLSGIEILERTTASRSLGKPSETSSTKAKFHRSMKSNVSGRLTFPNLPPDLKSQQAESTRAPGEIISLASGSGKLAVSAKITTTDPRSISRTQSNHRKKSTPRESLDSSSTDTKSRGSSTHEQSIGYTPPQKPLSPKKDTPVQLQESATLKQLLYDKLYGGKSPSLSQLLRDTQEIVYKTTQPTDRQRDKTFISLEIEQELEEQKKRQTTEQKKRRRVENQAEKENIEASFQSSGSAEKNKVVNNQRYENYSSHQKPVASNQRERNCSIIQKLFNIDPVDESVPTRQNTQQRKSFEGFPILSTPDIPQLQSMQHHNRREQQTSASRPQLDDYQIYMRNKEPKLVHFEPQKNFLGYDRIPTPQSSNRLPITEIVDPFILDRVTGGSKDRFQCMYQDISDHNSVVSECMETKWNYGSPIESPSSVIEQILGCGSERERNCVSQPERFPEKSEIYRKNRESVRSKDVHQFASPPRPVRRLDPVAHSVNRSPSVIEKIFGTAQPQQQERLPERLSTPVLSPSRGWSMSPFSNPRKRPSPGNYFGSLSRKITKLNAQSGRDDNVLSKQAGEFMHRNYSSDFERTQEGIPSHIHHDTPMAFSAWGKGEEKHRSRDIQQRTSSNVDDPFTDEFGAHYLLSGSNPHSGKTRRDYEGGKEGLSGSSSYFQDTFHKSPFIWTEQSHQPNFTGGLLSTHGRESTSRSEKVSQTNVSFPGYIASQLCDELPRRNITADMDIPKTWTTYFIQTPQSPAFAPAAYKSNTPDKNIDQGTEHKKLSLKPTCPSPNVGMKTCEYDIEMVPLKDINAGSTADKSDTSCFNECCNSSKHESTIPTTVSGLDEATSPTKLPQDTQGFKISTQAFVDELMDQKPRAPTSKVGKEVKEVDMSMKSVALALNDTFNSSPEERVKKQETSGFFQSDEKCPTPNTAKMVTIDNRGDSQQPNKGHVEVTAEEIRSNRKALVNDLYSNITAHSVKNSSVPVPFRFGNRSNSKWMKTTDKNTGRTIYLDTSTGNTSEKCPWDDSSKDCEASDAASVSCCVVNKRKNKLLDHDNQLELRHDRAERKLTISPAVQERLSSLLAQHNERITLDENNHIKWRDQCHNPQDESSQDLTSLFMGWHNPVIKFHQGPRNIEASSDANSSKRFREWKAQFQFHREMLDSLEVINQVDNKFILCTLKTNVEGREGKILVIIDQHAAHERVRLENLIKGAQESDIRLRSTKLTKPLSIELDMNLAKSVATYQRELAKIGLKFNRERLSSVSLSLNVTAVPTCLVEGTEIDSDELVVHKDCVSNLVHEHIQLLKATNGASASLPSVIQRHLASKACHGAIKFGDPLTMSQCKMLIEDLRTCDLPFQCAHGRPSIIPLLDITKIARICSDEERTQPNLRNLRERDNE